MNPYGALACNSRPLTERGETQREEALCGTGRPQILCLSEKAMFYGEYFSGQMCV